MISSNCEKCGVHLETADACAGDPCLCSNCGEAIAPMEPRGKVVALSFPATGVPGRPDSLMPVALFVLAAAILIAVWIWGATAHRNLALQEARQHDETERVKRERTEQMVQQLSIMEQREQARRNARRELVIAQSELSVLVSHREETARRLQSMKFLASMFDQSARTPTTLDPALAEPRRKIEELDAEIVELRSRCEKLRLQVNNP